MFSKLTVAILLVGSAFAAPSANLSKLKKAAKPVKNEYIVVLKDGASRSESLTALNDLVVGFDDVKEVKYNDWTVLNGYSAKLSGAALEHVLADPNVAYVEENGIVSINWSQEEHVAREAAPVAEERELSDIEYQLYKRAGEGVDVYGIDTGVFITHNDFGGRASWGAVFGGYAQADGNGHGTHTASTAVGTTYGSAKQASFIAVKVLSDGGSGTFDDVVSGVNFVTNAARASGKPSVANMSLGGSASTALDAAIRTSISAGVHYTLAAGNSNVNAANTSPARVTEAITVGALTSANAKASFSNFGAVLDVWFLGVSVTAAWIGSTSAINTISGTSMAAPGVAGIVATAISEYGNKSPADQIADLTAHAISGGATGVPSGTTTLRAVLY